MTDIGLIVLLACVYLGYRFVVKPYLLKADKSRPKIRKSGDDRDGYGDGEYIDYEELD